jgi:uncharacterized membrane protein YfcA
MELLLVALAGFCASVVDGALGMGFGPTSSSILLTAGLSPGATSTTVNLAKVVTGLASGVAHWRFRNVDRRLVLRLALPGCAGALVGVTILSRVDGDRLRPLLALLLVLVGLRILVRFSRPLPDASGSDAPSGDRMPPFSDRGTEVAAGLGGLTNGMIGAWGPVVTPFLLHRGCRPRWAVGSVNTAEVAVAFVSAGGLVVSLGGAGIDPAVVAAMLFGGVVGAPLAAFVVRLVPARALGLAVAALLLATNAGPLVAWLGLGPERFALYVPLAAGVIVAAARPALVKGRSRPGAPGGA